MKEILNVAVVGIGNISDIYLSNIINVFENICVCGVYDVVRENAQNATKKYDIPKIYSSYDELLKDGDVDIVLNLTRPANHYDISNAALDAGKHVYCEKPLADTFERGKLLLEKAAEKNLFFGCAPDTFLGAGIQTCRSIIERGVIGDVIGCSAQMVCHGWECWHPNPDFYYIAGGGPVMDMGPYYITAMAYLIGEITKVSGVSKTTFDKREVLVGERKGESITVEVPTWYNSILQFKNGSIGTFFATFDAYYPTESKFEIYGTKGTMIAPDPNFFDGPIKVFTPDNDEFVSFPLEFDYHENSRAIGISDMASAIMKGTEFRANAQQALHVLEVLEKVDISARNGTVISIESKYNQGSTRT